MDKKLMNEIEQAAYKLAGLLEEAALQKCETRDTGGVHWYVSEARKVGNLPRTIKLRFGQN